MKKIKKISCLFSAKWWLEDYGLRIVFIITAAIIITSVYPMAREDIIQNPFLVFVFIMGMLSMASIATFVYVGVVYLIVEVCIPAIKKFLERK